MCSSLTQQGRGNAPSVLALPVPYTFAGLAPGVPSLIMQQGAVVGEVCGKGCSVTCRLDKSEGYIVLVDLW